MTRAPDRPGTRRGRRHDEPHAGRQARRRAPWLGRARPRPVTSAAGRAGLRAALVPVRGRARRLRTAAAAIARELGQDGSSRAIAASFSLGLDRPGTPRARGRLSRRPRRRRASRQPRAPGLQRRAGLRGAGWPRVGARHAAQRSSLKGAAPACPLWLFVARGPGRPEGVAPVTRNAGLHRLRDGGRGIPRAGYRDFSLPACVRSPDNPRGLS